MNTEQITMEAPRLYLSAVTGRLWLSNETEPAPSDPETGAEKEFNASVDFQTKHRLAPFSLMLLKRADGRVSHLKAGKSINLTYANEPIVVVNATTSANHPLCKGCISFLNGCGKCQRCIQELDDKGITFEEYQRQVNDRREEVTTTSWDESTRGPRQSDVKGWTIFKYQMPILEEFGMYLPKDAEIIRVADQDGKFWMWAVVNTEAPMERRWFRAFKTGAPIEPTNGSRYYREPAKYRRSLLYIGFCAINVQMELGLYIFEEV